MLSNTGVIVLTMMLSGGSILHQGWNLLGEGEMKAETGVTPKRPSNLTVTGKSAVEMIVEILKGVARAVAKAYSNCVDGFKSLFRAKTPPSTTAKIKKKAAAVSSYLTEMTGQKKDRNLWSDLQAEIQRGVEDMWEKTVELKDFVFEVLKENEFLSILLTMLRGEDYIVFYAGVVIPMIFPQVYPLMGVLFWTIVACLQFVCGYKSTTLQQNLGWKRADRDEQGNEQERAESEVTGSFVEDVILEAMEVDVQVGAEETLEETVEKAPETSNAAEIPPTPFLHEAAPAKSVPTVNAGEKQQRRDDVIWRNCNSETECKRREERDDGRHPTRREKLGLPPFGVHDIRRVAPPIDATQAVRHAIEEVERRRQAKLAAARLLDEDDVDLHFGDPEEIEPPQGEELIVEARETRLDGDDKDKSDERRQVAGDQQVGELGDAATMIVGETKRAAKDSEDGDSIERKIDEEEQRERVKSRIRGVQAELHELKVLSEFVNTEDQD